MPFINLYIISNGGINNSLITDSPSQYIVIHGVDPLDAEFKKLSEFFGNNDGDISFGIGFILSYLHSPSQTIHDRFDRLLKIKKGVRIRSSSSIYRTFFTSRHLFRYKIIKNYLLTGSTGLRAE